MALDIDLEQPQPIKGEIKDFSQVLDQINREFARLYRNMKKIKDKAEETPDV